MNDNRTASAYTRQYPHHGKTVKCQAIPCMSCPLQPGYSWLPDLCAQRICLLGTACLRLHPCRKQGRYGGCPTAPSLLVWYEMHKRMLVRSFEIYFGSDLDFLSPPRDVYNLRWSLLNEVVSEVSICQQLQHNHDLQLFMVVGCILGALIHMLSRFTLFIYVANMITKILTWALLHIQFHYVQ